MLTALLCCKAINKISPQSTHPSSRSQKMAPASRLSLFPRRPRSVQRNRVQEPAAPVRCSSVLAFDQTRVLLVLPRVTVEKVLRVKYRIGRMADILAFGICLTKPQTRRVSEIGAGSCLPSIGAYLRPENSGCQGFPPTANTAPRSTGFTVFCRLRRSH
jgi:hypothetical protein